MKPQEVANYLCAAMLWGGGYMNDEDFAAYLTTNLLQDPLQWMDAGKRWFHPNDRKEAGDEIVKFTCLSMEGFLGAVFNAAR